MQQILDQSSSRLIYNLVHNGIAKVNLSGKGFLVNKDFEDAPNLYVMGPLLGGNKNERIHFWHLKTHLGSCTWHLIWPIVYLHPLIQKKN